MRLCASVKEYFELGSLSFADQESGIYEVLRQMCHTRSADSACDSQQWRRWARCAWPSIPAARGGKTSLDKSVREAFEGLKAEV